jgi:hypothetical protein
VAGEGLLYFNLDENTCGYSNCESVFNSDNSISENVLFVSKMPSAYIVHGAKGSQTDYRKSHLP